MPESTPTSPVEDAFSISGHTISDRATHHDTLGFKPYVEAIASFLISSFTQPPITISIEGEWGSGKSSFLLQLEDAICGPKRPGLFMALLPQVLGGLNDSQSFKEVLSDRRNRKPRPLTIRFNAWRHDKQDSLWAAFALAFVESLRKQIGWRRALLGDLRLFLMRLKGFRAWAELALFAFSFFILLVAGIRYHRWFTPANILAVVHKLLAPASKEVRLDPNLLNQLAVHGTWGALASLAIAGIYKFHSKFKMPLSLSLRKYISEPDYDGHVAFIESFHKDLQRLITSYASERNIYIFVDDLDRCDVPKAAELMQAINLMIGDSGNLFFVLGMDREKVAAGVALKYKDLFPFLRESATWKPGEAATAYTPLYFGYEYLEKFIQLSFTLPVPNSRAALGNFLARSSDPAPELGWFGRIIQVWWTVLSMLSGVSAPERLAQPSSGNETEPTTLQPPPANTAPATPRPEPIYRRVEIKEDSESTREIVRMTAPLFDYNPRRLKQFTNTFRLALFIASDQGAFDTLDPTVSTVQTPQQVGKAVALLLRFPDLRFALEQQLSLVQQSSWEKMYPNSGLNPKTLRPRLTLFADLQTAALSKQAGSVVSLAPELSYVAHWVETPGSIALLTYETGQDKYSLTNFDASRLLTLLPSAAAPPGRDLDRFKKMAIEYEAIRSQSRGASPARTQAMNTLLSNAIAAASKVTNPQEVLQSLNSGTPGQRIMSLAVAYAQPGPANIPLLLDILSDYKSWFEHNLCINTTRKHLAFQSASQRAQVVAFLDAHWDDIMKDPGRSANAIALRAAAAESHTDADRPPPPPTPRSEAVANDDIQHGRWGGKSEGYGCRLTIENVREERRGFTFDAVLEKINFNPFDPPFVFHLHDSYNPSVIRVTTTRRSRAILQDIFAAGTYTFGVQFRDDSGQWVSLEYDILSFDNGRLGKYDGEEPLLQK